MNRLKHAGLDPTKWKIGDLIAVSFARDGKAFIRAGVFVSIIDPDKVNARMMDNGRLLQVPFDRVARLG